MTDKQIIIDGVDVSGCLFYQTNFEEDYDVKIKHYCSEWHNSCESNNNSNCYYKQLKRKEDLINEIEDIVEPYQTEIEAEAFSLPTTIKSILERKEQECDMWKNLTVDNGAVALKYQQQLDQLKQALKEIKEIIKFNKTNRLSGGACISIEQILQKISEAIDEQ